MVSGRPGRRSLRCLGASSGCDSQLIPVGCDAPRTDGAACDNGLVPPVNERRTAGGGRYRNGFSGKPCPVRLPCGAGSCGFLGNLHGFGSGSAGSCRGRVAWRPGKVERSDRCSGTSATPGGAPGPEGRGRVNRHLRSNVISATGAALRSRGIQGRAHVPAGGGGRIDTSPDSPPETSQSRRAWRRSGRRRGRGRFVRPTTWRCAGRAELEWIIIPVLIYPDVREAVAWLSAAFGFAERVRIGENHRAQFPVR